MIYWAFPRLQWDRGSLHDAVIRRGLAPSLRSEGLETDLGRFELVETPSGRPGWIRSLEDSRKLPSLLCSHTHCWKSLLGARGTGQPGVLWALRGLHVVAQAAVSQAWHRSLKIDSRLLPARRD